MGNTSQSGQITPSTQSGFQNAAALAMIPVTSSGCYLNIGDAAEVILFVANASSSDTGAVWIEPGAKWAGSRGLAISTESSAYSTATAPYVKSVPTHGITGSSAIYSTTGSYIAWGPFESAKVKSSDEKIYIVASTGSTKMYVSAYAFIGGSTQ